MSAALTAYLKRVSLITIGALGAIFVAGLLGDLLSSAILFFLALLSVAIVVAVGILYLTLFVQAIKHAREPETSLKHKILAIVAAPVLLAALIFACLPSLRAGGFVGTFSRLVLNQSKYEAIIAQHQIASNNGPNQGYRVYQGIQYDIDSGPPIRIAFEPDGMLDNWSGIIYDPTGDVMKADGFDAKGKFYAPDRITKLFGGDLVSCAHLYGPYYRCGFT